MYEEKKKPWAGEPAFRRIKFPNEKQEGAGLGLLNRLGMSYQLGQRDGEYIVNSAQCYILTKNNVDYKKYDTLYSK